VNHYAQRLHSKVKDVGKFKYLDSTPMPLPPEPPAPPAGTRENPTVHPCPWQRDGYTADDAYTTVYGPNLKWVRVLRHLHEADGTQKSKRAYWPHEHERSNVPSPLTAQQITTVFMRGCTQKAIQEVRQRFKRWKELPDPSSCNKANQIGTHQERQLLVEFVRNATRLSTPLFYTTFVDHLCMLLESRVEAGRGELGVREQEVVDSRRVSRDWLTSFTQEHGLDLNSKRNLHRAEAKRMFHSTESRILKCHRYVRQAFDDAGLVDHETGHLKKQAGYLGINIDEAAMGVAPTGYNREHNLEDTILSASNTNLNPIMCAQENKTGNYGTMTFGGAMNMDGSLLPSLLLTADSSIAPGTRHPSHKAPPKDLVEALQADLSYIETEVPGKGLGPDPPLLNAHITYTPNAYITQQTFEEWLRHMRQGVGNFPLTANELEEMSLDDFNKYRRENMMVMVSDKHSSRWSQDSIDLAFGLGILLVYLEQHTTHATQPLDQVFASPKQINSKLANHVRRANGGKDPTWIQFRSGCVKALRIWASRRESRSKAFTMCGFRTDAFDPSLLRKRVPQASADDLSTYLGLHTPLDEYCKGLTREELEAELKYAMGEIVRLESEASNDLNGMRAASVAHQAAELIGPSLKEVSQRSLLVLPTGAATSSHVKVYHDYHATKRLVQQAEAAQKQAAAAGQLEVVNAVVAYAHTHPSPALDDLEELANRLATGVCKRMAKAHIVLCLDVVDRNKTVKRSSNKTQLYDGLRALMGGVASNTAAATAADVTPASRETTLDDLKKESVRLEKLLVAINTGSDIPYESMVSKYRTWVWTQADKDEAVSMQRHVEATPSLKEWQGRTQVISACCLANPYTVLLVQVTTGTASRPSWRRKAL